MQRGVMLVLVALVLAAQPAAAQQAAEADGSRIEGTVTRVGDGGFLVESRPGERSGSAKAYVEVTAGTEFLSGVTGARAGRDDLGVGSRVEVLFSGPVAESYPLQAAAARVVLLDGELPRTGGDASPSVLVPAVLAGVPVLLVLSLLAARRRW